MQNSTITPPARSYDLEQRTASFARRIRLFIQQLPRTVGNREDIAQLIRSSGSIAANYIEANESLGKKDFMMRIRISLKESKESRLWLSLLNVPSTLEEERHSLEDEAEQFVKIFCTILKRVHDKYLKIPD